MMERIPHSSSTVRPAHTRYLRGLVERNHVGRGPLCDSLRRTLAQTFERADAVLTDSGEASLALALWRLHSRHANRDEVVVSAYVCPAVVNAILGQGLRPVFADVAEESLGLGLDDVARHRLSDRTLAVICTHIGGEVDDLRAAACLGFPVISDCAQALGATLAGRSLLAFGTFATASFGATKVITAGLGGAVLGDSADCEAMHHFTRPELSVSEYAGSGFVRSFGQRFGDLNAGLALAQLGALGEFIGMRQSITAKYRAALHGDLAIEWPLPVPESQSNGFRCFFFSDRAAAWVRELNALGIDARNSISHVMTDYFPGVGPRPRLARQARRVVSVPVYPGLKAAQVARMVRALRSTAAQIERGGA